MDLLTVRETAEMLRVAPLTVRRYILSGRLEAVRIGRQVRIYRHAVESLLTPVASTEGTEPIALQRFPRPSAEEIARRRALFAKILKDREGLSIAPLTSADLIHMARAEEEQKYAGE